MKKAFRFLYIVLFFGLLCLPLLLAPFFRNDAALEKRAPAPFPDYIADGRLNLQFSDQFETWMNERLPLRAQLLTASNAIRAELLGDQSANVIVGKDGWLFFASEAPDYLGTTLLSEAQARAAAVTLSLIQEQVEAQGGRFCFACVPNKSSVYGEYLPDRYRRAAETGLTRLQALLPEYGVRYCDLLGLLRGAKDRGLLYHRRDSHWNYRGALLGANAILDSLGRPHDAHADAACSVEKSWRGDLDKLLLPAGGVPDEQIVWDVRHAAFRFTQPQGVADAGAQLEIFMSDREERDMSFATRNLEISDGSSLYMARDSFGRALLPWMIDSYQSAAFRRSDTAELRGLAPGTDVVLEIAERNLSRILAKAPFVYAPLRSGISAEGLPIGERLTVLREQAAYIHLYGRFPEGAELGDGRVYLQLEQAGRRLCAEAFPVCEARLLDAAGESGFSLFLSEELELSGRWELTVIAGGTAWPCGSMDF